MGRMDVAHDLIQIVSIFCKVGAFKFRKRCTGD